MFVEAFEKKAKRVNPDSWSLDPVFATTGLQKKTLEERSEKDLALVKAEKDKDSNFTRNIETRMGT
jgi:hypothetical protein